MTDRPTCSLVVTTYNWPEALRVVLEALRRQRVPPGEVLVADDGSTGETRALVERFQAGFPVPLRHLWHPDDGFRAGQIRNKAVAQATGAYIVQIDGDMVVQRDFVADHLDAARPGHFVGGSRVILGPEATARVLRGEPIPGAFGSGVRNRLNALRAPALARAAAAVLPAGGWKSVRGCNMGFWREDFVAVNGYDEAFVGWGREDTDLVIRFYRRGLRRRSFKLRGVAYHLHHRERSRDALERNDDLLRRAAERGDPRCAVGVSQYLGG
jgi:glycosyltransferase involved in cell wall biosynthesis